jgi:hypothetical protein
MGITRKIASLGTMGAVDFRSDKERAAAKAAKGARAAKATARQSKKQTKLLAEQNRMLAQMPPPQAYRPVPLSALPPPTPQAAPASLPPPVPPAPPAQDVAGQLQHVVDMHRNGLLSDDEFAAAKTRILGGPPHV